MADTGWHSPASAASVPYGTQAWSYPTRVYASDNSRSSARLSQDEESHYIRSTNYSMGVPVGAIINGIYVRIEKYASGAGIADLSARLVKAGTEVGSSKALGGDWSTEEGYVYYGGASDLWGTSWTAVQVNASNFGFSIAAVGMFIATSKLAYVDHIQIRVYYSEPGTNMKINIGDNFKDVDEIKINIGDSWKTVTKIQINIGDSWKTIFG